MSDARLVRYTSDGEWSALYVNGVLDRVGDHYLIDERIEELAGVEVHQSNDFLRGGDQREDVAKTLGELAAYTEERDARLERAEELRAEAARLLAEARTLED